jgi:hypothetical protein
MLPQYDPEGYEIPGADLWCDALMECELLDPEAGPPETWASWVDADTWELGPADRDDEHARWLRHLEEGHHGR